MTKGDANKTQLFFSTDLISSQNYQGNKTSSLYIDTSTWLDKRNIASKSKIMTYRPQYIQRTYGLNNTLAQCKEIKSTLLNS
jgi:hypothetical protein